MTTNFRNSAYAEHAQQAIDKMDEWANKDNILPETREQLVDMYFKLALVNSIMAVAQEISLVPSNMA